MDTAPVRGKRARRALPAWRLRHQALGVRDVCRDIIIRPKTEAGPNAHEVDTRRSPFKPFVNTGYAAQGCAVNEDRRCCRLRSMPSGPYWPRTRR